MRVGQIMYVASLIVFLGIIISSQFSQTVAQEEEQKINIWGHKTYDYVDFEAVDDNDDCPSYGRVGLDNYRNNFGALQDCYIKESKKREKTLDAVYSAIRARLSLPESIKLRDSQMRWYMGFGTECDLKIRDELGLLDYSTMYDNNIILVPCPTWRITQRIAELKTHYAALLEGVSFENKVKFPVSDQDFGLEGCLVNLSVPGVFNHHIMKEVFGTWATHIEGCYQSALQWLNRELATKFIYLEDRVGWEAYTSYQQAQKEWAQATDTQCRAQMGEEMGTEGEDAHLIWLQCQLEKRLERLDYFKGIRGNRN